MPRERTTWNREDIAKRASHSKSADPYLMNQDHVKGQPSAEKYVIGDPSDFAEDPHPSTGTWKAEYSSGQVKRNEIGLPEMRNDTFNHAEKTAGEAGLIAKAALAVSVSRAMLPKTASEMSVEAQATSLMHMPDVELAATYKRLVAEQEQEQDDDGDEDEGQKQAQDQGQQDQGQDDKQAGELPPALKKFNEEKKDKAEGKSDDKKEANQDQGQQDQGQDKQAQQVQVAQLQQQLVAMQQQVAQLLAQGQQQVAPQVVQAQQDQGQQDQDQGKQAQQDQGQQDQGQDKQATAARIQKAMADAIASGQDPLKAASEVIQSCQGPMGQQQTDAQLIDQMLAQPDQGVSDMGIEMQAPAMDVDVGDMAFTADDSILKQLFASDEDEQAQQDQGQKQAHAVRTASTRTVGTRPTAGVSQLGGLPSAGKKDDVSSLSSMWNQAPDVSAVFGTNGR